MHLSEPSGTGVSEPNNEESIALRDDAGNSYLVEIKDEHIKIKGVGVFNPLTTLSDSNFGDKITIGTKEFFVLPANLPERYKGMKRRAQTIQPKDAGFLITKLGIGVKSKVLEAGLGSGGLSIQIQNVMGKDGIHVTVEPRTEHADVGLMNIKNGQKAGCHSENHIHIEGTIEESVSEISNHCSEFDAIILDLPEHTTAIRSVTQLLHPGGRIACYCPVTSQVENAWMACEKAGLEIEWAGELIERKWGRAMKGGIRPVNGPFGHTAFLLIAIKLQN
ncbi:MAG: hypothetical protein VX613_05020, partial [Candidatus Thermoplasmatota archaeon]|nr:hypothetical protein [Candidatus Thermoplasmatota archaeon]